MNRALLMLLSSLLLASTASAQDIQLPASALTVENFVPLSELTPNGGPPRTLRAVDPLAIYSNVTNFGGQAFANAGSTASITRLVADNITFTTYPGASNVTTIRFSVANLNATTQSVRARVRFYDSTGASLGAGLPNGPGAYQTGFTFNAFSFGAGVTNLIGNLGTGFAVPANATTTWWAAITFDNVGTTTGATNAELNNFGTGLFNPVDVGSSTDIMFQTTAAGSFVSNNPAGAGVTFMAPTVANNGWEFVVTSLGTPVADLTLALTDTPDPVVAGTNITYLATSTNNGPNPAPGLTITLPLPASSTFVSATPSAGGICAGVAIGANGTLTCTWTGPTPSGAAQTVSVAVGVPANTANGASLTLNATTASSGTDPVPANNAASVTTAVITDADLSITLTDAPDPVTAGTSLTYTATLTNGGPSDAQGANIALDLPTVATFVSAAPSAGGVCVTPAVGASGTITCTWAGATAAGAPNARTVNVVAGVPANVADGVTLLATATADSATPDSSPANDQSSASTTVSASADLAIALVDAPDPVTAGTSLSYTATVTNAGPSDAQNVTISLPLPAGTSFISAAPSAGGSCNAASPVVCSWAGASTMADVRSVTVAVLVATAQTAPLSATATVSSSTTDPVAANNTATADTVVVVSADLAITLTDAPDPVTAGTNLTYTAIVSNAGPSDATGVSVSLPLPVGTSLVSGTVSGGGSCAGAPVVCSVTGSIAPTTARTLTIIVAVAPSVLEGTVLSATATVSAGSPDPVAGNNSASTTTTVAAEANLQLTLTASALEALINEPVTFTATSLNLGPSDAQNLSISMTLNPDFRYSVHTATGATCTTPQVGTTGTIACTWAGAVAPNASRMLQVVAYSNNEGATAVDAISTSDTSDPVAANNSGVVTVQVGFAVEEIPTLSQYGLIVLGLMLGLIGFVAVRRDS